jgi:hypothetical protein
LSTSAAPSIVIQTLSKDKFLLEIKMSRASTEMENNRKLVMLAVAHDALTAEDMKLMLLKAVSLMNTFEMEHMVSATKFETLENLEFELDL